MSRRHLDSVEVTHTATPDGPRPAQFLWRHRIYVVREVLGRWIEAGGWWRAPDVGNHSPDGLALADGAAAVDDREREVWRVEAGRASSTGVYDLAHESATGRWSLIRVVD